MIPPNINKENVLAAIKRIDSEGIHADRHLTVYVSSNDCAFLMNCIYGLSIMKCPIVDQNIGLKHLQAVHTGC